MKTRRGILGIAPLASCRCVSVSVGSGRAIVPTRTRASPRSNATSVPFRSPRYSEDEKLPRKQQDQQNELAAREEFIVEKDAEFCRRLRRILHFFSTTNPSLAPPNSAFFLHYKPFPCCKFVLLVLQLTRKLLVFTMLR